MKRIFFIIIYIQFFTNVNAKSIRRFSHVKEFYAEITEMVIELSLKHNTPPAVILAIAGLESGYGNGYVSQITGNILSLGANPTDIQLPALYLPRVSSSQKIIFDKNDIQKYNANELNWKLRPPSKKKDYRPANIAGSKNNLTYLNHNKEARYLAHQNNIKDFLTIWLNREYPFEIFADARIYLDNIVRKNGKNILFNEQLNNQLIEMLGGKPRSFNTNKEWVTKVKWIMNNAKLIELCKNIYYQKMTFEEAWLIE